MNNQLACVSYTLTLYLYDNCQRCLPHWANESPNPSYRGWRTIFEKGGRDPPSTTALDGFRKNLAPEGRDGARPGSAVPAGGRRNRSTGTQVLVEYGLTRTMVENCLRLWTG